LELWRRGVRRVAREPWYVWAISRWRKRRDEQAARVVVRMYGVG